MTHASLFSGIGGPDLAAEKMGWENVFHCEINPFGQKILKYYWPNAINYEDIKTTDFTIHRGTIDVLTGGFPCQPYSTAGLRKGKEDERHLWPEMLRAIREIKPRWIVGENVLGLVSWNDGLVFEEVQTDLEAEGYEVQPYVLPAVSVDAPHRRDRVWFVAYSHNSGSRRSTGQNHNHQERKICKYEEKWDGMVSEDPRHSGIKTPANPSFRIRRAVRRHETRIGREKKKFAKHRNFRGNGFITYTSSIRRKGRKDVSTWQNSINGDSWDQFPTQSPVCSGNDGFPPRLDGVTFSKWRTESIKAGGNAIVHQVIIQIFKAIDAYELINHP